MQYCSWSVSITNGSTSVVGAAGTKFLTNASPGYAFKVKGDPVIYTIASVTDDNTLVLSAPFQGVTNAVAQYQITTSYTSNLGLAEIDAGDQDWAVHLTQEVIRKLDTVVGSLVADGLTWKDGWDASTGLAIATGLPIPLASAENIGWTYKVITAGTFDVDGNTPWYEGDSLISNGSTWVRIPGAAYAELLTLAENLLQTQTILVNRLAFS